MSNSWYCEHLTILIGSHYLVSFSLQHKAQQQPGKYKQRRRNFGEHEQAEGGYYNAEV